MSDSSPERDALGDRIRSMREELGMTREALAREISVSSRYIRALEEGDYSVFGARVYAQGVLKKMVALIAPADVKNCMDALREAWDVHADEGGGHSRLVSTVPGSKWYVTPKRAGIGIAATLLATFIFFAGARLIRFNAPPVLVIDEPQPGVALAEPAVALVGRTERESKLTVNGRELTIDEQGNFHERIELQTGVNKLTFLSENRFGKNNSIVRYVVVE